MVAAAPAEQPQQQQPAQGHSDPDSDRPASQGQTYGDPDAQGLSQLSDLADLGSEPGPGASQYKPPTSVQMAISSQSQVLPEPAAACSALCGVGAASHPQLCRGTAAAQKAR